MNRNRFFLHSVLLFTLLSTATSLFAQTADGAGKKGQFSIFANFGGGSFKDDSASVILNNNEVDVTAKITALKLGLGINYAHPINTMFSIGAMLELRLLFTSSEYSTAPLPNLGRSISVNLEGTTGLGLTVGPYFRLGLWGADKKGGIGFAPYFLINSLRPVTNNKLTIGGTEYTWNDDSVLGLGGGLMVDIYFVKNFGFNLGLELQYADFNSTFKTGVDGGGGAGVFGPLFYGGIIISF